MCNAHIIVIIIQLIIMIECVCTGGDGSGGGMPKTTVDAFGMHDEAQKREQVRFNA